MRGAVKGTSLAGIAAAVAVLASLAANAATSEDRWPGALDRIRQQPWWWVTGLAVAGILVAVVLAWRQERPAAVAGDPPTPSAQTVPDWVSSRKACASARDSCVRSSPRGRSSPTSAYLFAGLPGGFGGDQAVEERDRHPGV
ncbi:hypothetical protein [Streptomyces sp. ID05-18]|uniref:hypothetical protein n=1 Tax=Streptomyces sp. ID05-18 TaxID=3028662 RepID=UPI0029A0746C|nr:hypothetical protein [Streptomyces sp. ID05-18]MDX3488364.1 hypothetical protein [Streptomyces sp. ID05-18]